MSPEQINAAHRVGDATVSELRRGGAHIVRGHLASRFLSDPTPPPSTGEMLEDQAIAHDLGKNTVGKTFTVQHEAGTTTLKASGVKPPSEEGEKPLAA